MLIRLSCEELAAFGEPDFVIYNGGAFPANKLRQSCKSAAVCVVMSTAFGA
jgi:phosphoenolpyruvate carboxykinase (ATP)